MRIFSLSLFILIVSLCIAVRCCLHAPMLWSVVVVFTVALVLLIAEVLMSERKSGILAFCFSRALCPLVGDSEESENDSYSVAYLHMIRVKYRHDSVSCDVVYSDSSSN